MNWKFDDSTVEENFLEKEILKVEKVELFKKLLYSKVEIKGFSSKGGSTYSMAFGEAMEEGKEYYLNKKLAKKIMVDIYFDHLAIGWVKGTPLEEYLKAKVYLVHTINRRWDTITMYYDGLNHNSLYSKSREVRKVIYDTDIGSVDYKYEESFL